MLLPILLLASGCSSTIGRATMISTKNLDFTYTREVVARGESELDGRFWFLFIPLGSKPRSLKLIDDLLSEHEGDYLTNVVATGGGWSFIIAGYEWVKVESDVWRMTAPKPMKP